MTKFYSPERPLSGSRPAWHEAPQVSLPAILIYPSDLGIGEAGEGHQWHCQIMLPNGRGYSWKETTIHREDLARLLSDWYSDPEEALRHWWGARPIPTSVSTSASRVESQGAREIEKTSGDLGL